MNGDLSRREVGRVSSIIVSNNNMHTCSVIIANVIIVVNVVIFTLLFSCFFAPLPGYHPHVLRG